MDRTARPTDPQDGSEQWVLVVCLNWERWFPLDGSALLRDKPLFQAPRLEGTASTDSPPASRLLFLPPFAS